MIIPKFEAGQLKHQLLTRIKGSIAAKKNSKVVKLQQKLRQTKTFLAMVIHDMRNPTLSMKMNSNVTLKYLKSIFNVLDDFKQFQKLWLQVREQTEDDIAETEDLQS